MGNLNDFTPTVNFANRLIAQPGNRWGPRTIPDCQLVYVVSGELQLQLGRQQFVIRAGECAYYGPGSPHILMTVQPSVLYTLHFSWHASSANPVHPAYSIQEVEEKELQHTIEPQSLTCDGREALVLPHRFVLAGAVPLLSRIEKQYVQLEDPGAPFALRFLLMELLLHIVRTVVDRAAKDTDNKVEPALHALRDEPTRNWTVAELSALCGYHPSYFAILFAEQTGMTPKQYIISERIKLAKQALLKGEPIEAIANKLGYTSVHYFSNNFKKETGLTPGEFRQMPGERRGD
ncbi:helix-turn-helix domain-containing protein [Paenibacillus sp. GCM10027626]|uniref:AraC family transcriptional regulator n=1 Tax=Paenibacillus sp. GCM10027626 TaxID=3273411 RepID=UPI00363E3BAF